jgi:hypothetical protein
MKVLETIEVETQFTPGQPARLEADLQLVQAFSQNNKLLKLLHEARDEALRAPPAPCDRATLRAHADVPGVCSDRNAT